MVVQHCAVHSTQSVNTGGALAANKSARAMLGPPDTALLHVCGPPRPGVANRPSSGACCVGLGQGQRGAHSRGSRGQRRVTYQRTRLIKPRPASHGTAAAMRARIAGPSITHSSNKAWQTPTSARLSPRSAHTPCCRTSPRKSPADRGRRGHPTPRGKRPPLRFRRRLRSRFGCGITRRKRRGVPHGCDCRQDPCD